jgi:hypothetical protein
MLSYIKCNFPQMREVIFDIAQHTTLWELREFTALVSLGVMIKSSERGVECSPDLARRL